MSGATDLAPGALEPGNPCRECNPQLNAGAWSVRAAGTSCDDGLYCTEGDTCNAQGTCSGQARSCGGGAGVIGQYQHPAADGKAVEVHLPVARGDDAMFLVGR